MQRNVFKKLLSVHKCCRPRLNHCMLYAAEYIVKAATCSPVRSPQKRRLGINEIVHAQTFTNTLLIHKLSRLHLYAPSDTSSLPVCRLNHGIRQFIQTIHLYQETQTPCLWNIFCSLAGYVYNGFGNNKHHVLMLFYFSLYGWMRIFFFFVVFHEMHWECTVALKTEAMSFSCAGPDCLD